MSRGCFRQLAIAGAMECCWPAVENLIQML
jgi:hypothetical protein